MKLGVFLSEFRCSDAVNKLRAERLGVFLVGNGVYHAVLKENGKASSVLDKKGANFYVLSEDLQSRGFAAQEVDSRVKLIDMPQLVDAIMGDYEKLAWL